MIIDVHSYVPVEPLIQVKGKLASGSDFIYFKADQNGELIYKYDGTNWLSFKDYGPFEKPLFLEPAINPTEQAQIESAILSSEMFKVKTEYMIFGDEEAYSLYPNRPRAQGVFNLADKLGAARASEFRSFLKFLPRPFLQEWFAQNILQEIDSRFSTNYNATQMVWAGIIDLFNQANLEHINQAQILPWDWEEEKLRMYYESTNQEHLDTLNSRFNNYVELYVSPDPEASALMLEYSKLPALGDIGLEISRQFAVRELLSQKDYESVRGIIDAYRLAETTILSKALKGAIPFDIHSKDGFTIKATN